MRSGGSDGKNERKKGKGKESQITSVCAVGLCHRHALQYMVGHTGDESKYRGCYSAIAKIADLHITIAVGQQGQRRAAANPDSDRSDYVGTKYVVADPTHDKTGDLDDCSDSLSLPCPILGIV